MKRIFLVIITFLFIQCEAMFDGEWGQPIRNLSKNDVIFGIDVNVVDGNIYARESYYDPNNNFLEYSERIYPNRYNVYSFSSNRKTYINIGDTVSVYAIDPIDLEMYSWDEIREKKKFWFARVVLDVNSDYIYFPFELNR